MYHNRNDFLQALSWVDRRFMLPPCSVCVTGLASCDTCHPGLCPA